MAYNSGHRAKAEFGADRFEGGDVLWGKCEGDFLHGHYDNPVSHGVNRCLPFRKRSAANFRPLRPSSKVLGSDAGDLALDRHVYGGFLAVSFRQRGGKVGLAVRPSVDHGNHMVALPRLSRPYFPSRYVADTIMGEEDAGLDARRNGRVVVRPNPLID